jgi:TetR/AcrR family transcriptional regulator
MPRKPLPPPPGSPPPRRRRRSGTVEANRQPGRPARAGEDLREALVDAALHGFATDGFAASTLRGIAAAAGVTPAMAHYYFGDKAGLLAAVVEHRVQPLAARIAARVGAAGEDPIAALRAFIEAYESLAFEHPWVPRLVVREVLGEGGVLRETFTHHFAARVGEQLLGRIRAAQAQGRIDPALDAPKVALSFLSLCVFPVISAPVIPVVLGVPVGREHVAALASHQFEVFLNGVGPKP